MNDPEERWSPDVPKARIDNVHHFECSRCRLLVDASEGGGPDEYDLNGTLCSFCWGVTRRLRFTGAP